VWLDAAALKLPSSRGKGQKLGPLYHGPFVITKVPSDVTVELKLGEGSRRKHAVFHVSRLKKWISGDDTQFINRAPADPPTALDVEDDIWIIEKLLDKRWRHNREEVLVRWDGFGPSDDMWVPVTLDRLTEDVYRDALNLPLSNPDAAQRFHDRIGSNRAAAAATRTSAVPPAIAPPASRPPVEEPAQQSGLRRSGRNRN